MSYRVEFIAGKDRLNSTARFASRADAEFYANEMADKLPEVQAWRLYCDDHTPANMPLHIPDPLPEQE